MNQWKPINIIEYQDNPLDLFILEFERTKFELKQWRYNFVILATQVAKVKIESKKVFITRCHQCWWHLLETSFECWWPIPASITEMDFHLRQKIHKSNRYFCVHFNVPKWFRSEMTQNVETRSILTWQKINKNWDSRSRFFQIILSYPRLLSLYCNHL